MKNFLLLFAKFARCSGLPLALLSLAPSLLAQSAPAIDYAGQIEPRSGENFSYAQYCCWLPPQPAETKGVLCIVLHPHGNTGVEFDRPEPWIDLARQYHCALLSLSFVDAVDKTRNWSHAFEGSGRALVAALDEVAVASKVPALSRIRVVVAGICEAGQFAYGFSAYAPERTAAFMTMGGSLHQVPLARLAAGTTGLLVAASDRDHSAFDNMAALFAEGRRYSAPWEFTLERIKDYDDGHSSVLVGSFLRTALARLQESSSVTPPGRPDSVPRAEVGTLAQTAEPDAWSVEDAPGNSLDGAADEPSLWEVTVAHRLAEPALPPLALSFVSVPLPARGHVGAERLNLGAMRFAAGVPEQADATFEIYASDGSAVDGISVASDLVGLSWQTVRVGTSEWQVHCKIDLSSLPSGAFVVPVPLRFLVGSRVAPGGINTLVSGWVVRDVSAEPSAINFGRLSATTAKKSLRLKSASGLPVQVVGWQSTVPRAMNAEVAATGKDFVEVVFTAGSTADLPRAFSGYYLLRVKSNTEQTVKVLFFGEDSAAVK